MKKLIYNIKPILKNSLSTASSIFGLVGILTAFVSWDDMKIDLRRRIVLLILIVVLSFVFASLYILFFQRKNCLWKNGTGSVNVIYGDLIKIGLKKRNKKDKVVVIPVNTSFDTIVDSAIATVSNPLISPASIHGQWLEAVKKNHDESEIQRKVQEAISTKGLKCQRTYSKSEKPRGNLECYERGSSIFVSFQPKTTFMLVALSDFDSHNNGQCSEEEFIKVVMDMLNEYNDFAQAYDIFIPLMGTGCSRVNLSNKESLQKIKACIEICKKKIHGSVYIVVYRGDMDTVSIFD